MTPLSTSPPLAGRFLTAHWRWLAMLNYEVPPELLAPLTPRGVQLDHFAGRTYVSVVGFLFVHTKVLGIPIPWHRHFEELNLRFYVRRDVEGETRRGVVFVKELVPRWAIAQVAHLDLQRTVSVGGDATFAHRTPRPAHQLGLHTAVIGATRAQRTL